MYLDPISEAIAHFIGHFSTKLEAAKLREMYDEFAAAQKLAIEADAISHGSVTIQSPYDLNDLNPVVRYFSPAERIEMLKVGVPLSNHWIGANWPSPWTVAPNSSPVFGLSALKPSVSIYTEPPGAIAVVVEQYNSLTDDDFVSFVDHEIQELLLPDAQGRLVELKTVAEQLDPVGAIAAPSGEASIAESIVALSDLIGEVSTDFGSSAPSDSSVHIFGAEEIAGIHVNGALVDAVPKLSEFRPSETEVVSEEHSPHAQGVGSIDPDASLEISTGGNTLVNQAFLSSSWTVSPEIAVDGDAVSINIINQINVWSDLDSISELFTNWVDAEAIQTQAFNIASVITELASPAGEATEPTGAPQFPTVWSVTTIEGNLVFLNWLEQLNLVSDNDVSILTHTGSQTYVETGGNLTVNQLTMLGLGHNFDLILIGGSYYSANVINQTNVLLDDDVISSGDGFATSGEGSLETHGNLLWNQAAIQVIGSTTFTDLPAHYAQALTNLASGNETLPPELLNDPAFMGLMGLRVLYISGDLIDLQYINQTNILGDSDIVHHVADELSPDHGGPWQEVTGDNTLINIATIFDAHDDMTIHVGGEVYSDALLHQAGFVAEADDYMLAQAKPLASEAVLFLADGMIEESQTDDNYSSPLVPADGIPADVMQTMLA